RRGERLAVLILGIAGEDEACRSGGVNRAVPALQEQGVTELVAAPELIVGRDRGLPAYAEVDGQMRCRFEGILHIGGHDRLAQVIGDYIPVGQVRKTSDQKVGQAVPAGGAAESELTVGLLVVEGIELILAAIEAEG